LDRDTSLLHLSGLRRLASALKGENRQSPLPGLPGAGFASGCVFVLVELDALIAQATE
jgi:hypothetical protein